MHGTVERQPRRYVINAQSSLDSSLDEGDASSHGVGDFLNEGAAGFANSVGVNDIA